MGFLSPDFGWPGLGSCGPLRSDTVGGGSVSLTSCMALKDAEIEAYAALWLEAGV